MPTLPTRGVYAWHCTPLLPWMVQCPARVCTASRQFSGDRAGAVLPPSCFPLTSRTLPCLLQVARSGCPLPSAAGMPFHAVCAAPLAHCVCVRSRSRGVHAHPLCVTRALCAVPVQGSARAVPAGPCPSAFPALVLCSACLLCGGACPVPASPYSAPGCAPPRWCACLGGTALVASRDVQRWAIYLLQSSFLGAGGLGPLPSFPRARGVPAWGPVSNPRVRALASWLCALWRRHKDTRGGGSPGFSVGAVRGWVLSLPQLPVVGAGGRGQLLVCRGRGNCGHGDPSSTLQRTLLRADFFFLSSFCIKMSLG